MIATSTVFWVVLFRMFVCFIGLFFSLFTTGYMFNYFVYPFSLKLNFSLSLCFTFKAEASTPSSGFKKDEQTLGTGEDSQDTITESKGNKIFICTHPDNTFL